MKSWVVTGLTAIACLLGGAAELFAQYYDEAPSAGATGAAPPEAKADGAAKPKGRSKGRARRPRSSSPRSSSGSAEDYEESGRRVWTETNTARVKTVYDDQGNVVYQKAWDKKSGKEIPVPDAGRDADEDTSRAQGVHDAPEAKPYGRLRRDEDGEYEERRQDPRPRAKNHHLHKYDAPPRKHPYEFSLGVYPWFNVLDGSLTGSIGTGTLNNDQRTSYEIDFNNPRVGYSYTHIAHNSKLSGTFTFQGTTFAADAVDVIYSETLSILDGFYRFNCYDSRDCWMDFLLGGKALFLNASVTGAGVLETVDTIVPLPQLGILGSYSLLDNIKFRGFVKGAFGALSDSSATVIDAEVEAVYTFPGDNEYNLLNQFSLGYRFLQIDFTTGANSADEASGSVSHDGLYVKYQALF